MRSLIELPLMPLLFIPMLFVKVWEHYFMMEKIQPVDFDNRIINKSKNL